MQKRIVLSLGKGSLQTGFPAVTAQLWEQDNPHAMKFVGALPAAPEIPRVYRAWQMLYRAMHHRLNWHPRMEIEAADVTNVSEAEFKDLCQRLALHINDWLDAAEFRAIDQPLRTHLDAHDEICLMIETDDALLQQLPWHLWHFFDAYPRAEVALSPSSYHRPAKTPTQRSSNKIKILVVLGSSEDIDVERDRTYLSRFDRQAEVSILTEPSREALTQALWQGCDLLFFAGHSSSRAQGELQLNAHQSLTLEQLKYALRGAIAQGLKLAIFNSCDGLGLARSLADLSIAQVIVMREPVPDRVAQDFLKHFLAAFAQDHSLYLSVRAAREKLQGLEADYPCASWLPAIYQNPAEPPATWRQWQENLPQEKEKEKEEEEEGPSIQSLKSLWVAVLASLLVTPLVAGVRHLGWLQPSELWAFDQLMMLRPEESIDPRLLLITVTETDFQLPAQAQRKGSLSDLALEQLLQKLEPMQPKAIGLDIYRDFPTDPKQSGLATRLSRQDNLYAICKGSDRDGSTGIAPPPEISKARQGFSDIVKDPDNVLRRHLIAMNPPGSTCTTPYALSAQLAFHYLASSGIFAEYSAAGALQIGDVPIPQLQPSNGGHQTVYTWGYQTLINYRAIPSDSDIAPTLTLAQALSDQLQAEDVKNRIVLIGVTAASVGDSFSTPYSANQGHYQQQPGVVVQAHMISQILSAVEDGRPLLKVWPRPQDLLWLLVWAAVGGALAWRCRSGRSLMLAAVAALSGLSVGCFWLFMLGIWAPLIPAGLALLLTGGSTTVYFASSKRGSSGRLRHRATHLP